MNNFFLQAEERLSIFRNDEGAQNSRLIILRFHDLAIQGRNE